MLKSDSCIENNIMPTEDYIKIYSPATIANMGPGFDCIGGAIDLWNEFEFIFHSTNNKIFELEIEVKGEGENSLPLDKSNLAYKAFSIPFKMLQINIPKINIKIKNNINLESGLGSSSSAISAGLLAANYYIKKNHGQCFSKTKLLNITKKLEDHYDNLAACINGGIKLCIQNKSEVIISNIEYDPNIKLIIIIPNSKTNTNKSRTKLPKTISTEKFVHNMSRLSLLTNSLKSPNTNTIKTAFDDVFHQNIRLENYPKLTKLLNKIPEIGGLGSFLCGSGPTIAGITTDNPMSFFYEVADYCDKQNIEAKLLITSFTSKGAYIKN